MARRPAPPVPQIISDLIDVPPIRTVIQLVDTERPELRAELLDSFVFTAEVRDLFARLLHALAEPTGLGAFLKGHYGSGKSHCLTFLQMLLEHDPRAWERLPQELQRPSVQQREWVVVTIPLLAHSAHTRLETAVMEAIEAALARGGERPVLADRSRLLENFQRFIVPAYPDLLQGWGELPPEQAASQALEFLRKLPHNPLQLSYDRRATMEQLAALLQGRGMVLLLDELSEFLRSKGNSYQEDIRYLQFLGEWAEKLPLWIVASLQQNLDELGYGEEAAYLRIKERYPLRFSLSAHHVADLIEGRLIHRKEGSAETLRELWRGLDKVFPDLISEHDFMRIYPVHPATLELLEHLMTLFSRHRGVVDFVHTRLAGNPLKGAEGILGEPIDRLLTPDTIFDHFRERFSELAHLAPYEQTVWAHLSEEIPRLFEAPRDRELALQVLKLLILIEVCPVPVARSATKLAQMLARRISKVNAAVNVTYLRENILDVLVQRAAFVVRRGDEYAIDLAANVNQVLGQRVREKRQKMTPDWGSAMALVNRATLPLADLSGKPPQVMKFRWRNSERSGLWGLISLEKFGYQDLTRVLTRLEEEEFDLGLLLLSLGDASDTADKLLSHARQHPRGAGLVLWQPAPPDHDLEELLLDWLSHRAVLQETRERQLRSHLETLVEGQQERLQRSVFDLFMAGRLLTVEGSAAPPAYEAARDRMLALIAGPCLERLFPGFAEIAPTIDGLTGRNLERLWNECIRAAGKSEGLEALIEGLLMPLQLVEKEADSWRIRLNPVGPAAALMDLLPVQQRVPLAKLQSMLHKSKLGLVHDQFCLVLATLTASGRVQLFSHGRPLTLNSIDELRKKKVEEVALIPGLQPQQIEQLQQLQWMVGDAVPPTRPKEFWSAARDSLQELAQTARVVGSGLSRLGGSEALPVARLSRHIEHIQSVAAAVGTPTSSTTGLTRLLEHGAGQLRESQAEIQRWGEFVRVAGHDFESARRRLKQAGEEPLLQAFTAISESPDPGGAWDELKERYLDWDAAYRQRYQEAHQAYYADPRFALHKELLASPEWKALEQLSHILGVDIQPSPAHIRQQIHNLPQPCRKRLEDQLLLGVRCACGFEPGQPLPDEPPILQEIRQALTCGCRSLVLQESNVEEYLRGLHKLGQAERAQRLESALTLLQSLADPGPGPGFWSRACSQLLAQLQPPVIESLSQALTGHTLLVSRQLETLVEALQDKRLPPDRLRHVFDSWLQGDGLRGDCWIHVESRQGSTDQSGAWLKRWLDLHGLRPTAAMRRRYQLEGEPEGEPPEEELYDLALATLSQLDPVVAATRETLFPRLSAEMCRRALEQGGGRGLRQLPQLPWEHLEVARIAAAVVEALDKPDFPALAVALREWSRAQQLDLSARLLTPALEESITARLRKAMLECQVEAIPLEQVPLKMASPWLGERRLIVLLVDGLRWDLWHSMRALLVEELGHPSEERLALSPLPSVTAKARQVLLGGEEEIPPGADGLLLGRPLTYVKAADEKRHRDRVEALLRGPESAVMLHLGFIDRRRHETTLDLWPLYCELLAEARQRLLPLIRQIPKGCLLLLTADHGFLDPQESRAHGGARWEERVVPAVVWLR